MTGADMVAQMPPRTWRHGEPAPASVHRAVAARESTRSVPSAGQGRGARVLLVVDRRNQSGGSICLTMNGSFSSGGEAFEDEVRRSGGLGPPARQGVAMNIRGSFFMRANRNVIEEAGTRCSVVSSAVSPSGWGDSMATAGNDFCT
jgi:hypothetical protein